jgi:hypothetical protein
MTTFFNSPPLPPPTLEEALQSLQALAMGGQSLMEVMDAYVTVRDALLHFSEHSHRIAEP